MQRCTAEGDGAGLGRGEKGKSPGGCRAGSYGMAGTSNTSCAGNRFVQNPTTTIKLKPSRAVHVFMGSLPVCPKPFCFPIIGHPRPMAKRRRRGTPQSVRKLAKLKR